MFIFAKNERIGKASEPLHEVNYVDQWQCHHS